MSVYLVVNENNHSKFLARAEKKDIENSGAIKDFLLFMNCGEFDIIVSLTEKTLDNQLIT